MRCGQAVILGGFLLCAGWCALGCRDDSWSGRSVYVIGMDGMDPKIVEKMMAQGRLPHFSKLRAEGCFSPLGTSIPPQSPVAWSNLITGSDARLHNVFDFIHRKWVPSKRDKFTKEFEPYLSTAEAGDEPKTAEFGEWAIPYWGGEGQVLLRRGKPFWEYLTEAGIPALVFRMPSQFPPGKASGAPYHALTGMGTPDMSGGYGSFSLYKSAAGTVEKGVSGGKICRLLWMDRDRAEGELVGPANYLRKMPEGKSAPAIRVPFTIDRDPENAVAAVNVQGQRIVMQVGEWSDWVRVEFDTGIPYGGLLSAAGFPTSTTAICRMLLRATHPEIELYVSPLNIDPENPFQPISEPADWAAKLAAEKGLFYTQGIPEEHSGLSEDALNDEQYVQQATHVLEERFAQLDFALKEFKGGMFFFYFGSTDQQAHMIWRARDPDHPLYTRELEEQYGDLLEKLYEQMDRALEIVMQRVGKDDLLIVCSDHGFNSFARGVNLNTWLLAEGYIKLYGNFPQDKYEMFIDVDWSRTKAYAFGINCLYLNVRGRDGYGIVDAGEREALMEEISRKLKELRDPKTGERAIAEVYRTDKVFPGCDPETAPDLIVGYAAGYRSSWATGLGKIPLELFEDNKERWSGDHCVAADIVPGVLLANRRLKVDAPNLSDVAPSILREYGLAVPQQMIGRPLF